MTDAARQHLDDAVADGRLTKPKEQQVLADLKQRFQDLVNAQLRLRFRDGHGFGLRGLDGLRGPAPSFGEAPPPLGPTA